MFRVVIQLENKRFIFALGVPAEFVPGQIRVPAESESVFGFNQGDCGGFVVA